jgi:hypothetical protein
LPDVNLWIGLTSNRHVHHAQAKAWLEGLGDERIAFCRITELGLLRLLTNQHVMGEDVLAPPAAWLERNQSHGVLLSFVLGHCSPMVAST